VTLLLCPFGVRAPVDPAGIRVRTFRLRRGTELAVGIDAGELAV